MTADWREELFKDQTLWSVFRRAQGLGESRFNTVALAITFVGLTSFAAMHECVFHRSLVSLETLRMAVVSWAGDGIGFTTQLLGFLVAGFTIFATLTKVDVFKKMAIAPYKESGVTALDFVFLNFLLVFIHFISFLAYCVVVKLFLTQGGPLAAMVRVVAVHQPWLNAALIYGGIILTGTWFIYLILLLKSFVWNVYQSILVSIAVEAG